MSTNNLEDDVDVELGLVNEETQKGVPGAAANTESPGDEEQGPTPTETVVKFALPEDITNQETDGEQKSVEGITECESNGTGEGNITTNDSEDHVEAARPHLKRQRQSSLHWRKQLSEYNASSEIHTMDKSVKEESTVGISKYSGRGKKEDGFQLKGCVHRLFLDPSYSLRRQMLLTFGSVSSLTILLVMIVAIVASVSTGNAVKEKATPRVDEWVQEFVSSTSRYVAQALSPKIMVSPLLGWNYHYPVLFSS